jgi:nucleotide-binding universal stress UspA family protein
LEEAIMFETILVPTDGSEHAKKAVLLASDIAEKYQARLVLLHVMPRGPLSEEIRRMARVEHITAGPAGASAPLTPEGKFPASTVLGTKSDLQEQTEQVLQFLADRILADAKHVAQDVGIRKVSTVILDGDPADQILRHAEKEGANLIVMGSRGLGDLKGLLMGSVSHKVSQLSPCSCITVK